MKSGDKLNKSADKEAESKTYLLLDVIKRVGGVNGKADEDDVGVRIT